MEVQMKKTVVQVAVVISAVVFLFSSALAQQWTFIAPMKHGRVEPKCAPLKDGRIMVAGGFDQSGMVSECEIYDPNTNTWSSGGNLKQGRYRYSLIALDN